MSVQQLKILVTGGAGYIGSHTVRELLKHHASISIIDNYSRGHKSFLARLGIESQQIFEGSLQDFDFLNQTLNNIQPDVVIHFAAHALVGESVIKPALYWENNICGTLNLCRAMISARTKNIVFSSSCSVYGNQSNREISETSGLSPLNPYAFSKFASEQLLKDFAKAYSINSTSLRYFNAAGASHDALLGELHDPETHLIPLVFKSILDSAFTLEVFGNDYPTRDGTCIRDYIHVEDLAAAHVLAALRLNEISKKRSAAVSDVYNLGTGKGASVLEIIRSAEQIAKRPSQFRFSPRREGDPASLVANPAAALRELGWQARLDLKSILESAWKWHTRQGLTFS